MKILNSTIKQIYQKKNKWKRSKNISIFIQYNSNPEKQINDKTISRNVRIL